MTIQRVSIHGGHSGRFCNHARDTLAEIVQSYRDKGFVWVGITEHMPPVDDRFLYPEERQAGLTARAMLARFRQYMAEARRLQDSHRGDIEILVGFETEANTGSRSFALELIREEQPDFIVGGVHHVDDIPFDYSPAEYGRAVRRSGGLEELYCRYFDLQHELINALKPQVIAHFDLIRIYDPDYPSRLKMPAVSDRIRRNLKSVARLGLILDFNVAALRKGATEPYVTGPILRQALELGISVVPGDDSHSVATAGENIDQGIAVLRKMGFDTHWRKPAGRSFNP